MSPPVRFVLDKRAFGVVHFPRQKGKTRFDLQPLQTLLGVNLGVRPVLKREGLFGRKALSFTYLGETVKVRLSDAGDAQLDLSHVDDEAREQILEQLRQSHDFEGY
ncbi:MAG: hypothetical protein ACXU8U_08670 [Asticcacaulis sp.]